MPRDSSLTGGTRDVNPQFLSIRAVQTGTDVTFSAQIPLPIQRLPTGGKAQVVEVLKVFFEVGTNPPQDNGIVITLSTRDKGVAARANWGDPQVFAQWTTSAQFVTTGGVNRVEPFQLDLTDGAGHGLLIGTDSIFVQVYSSTTGLSNEADIKILYRFKNVPVTEYIGIVQSQQ